MERILFICSDFYSDTDASGICIRNIIAEGRSRGIKFYVITESSRDACIEKEDNLEVYGIKKPWFAFVSDALEGQKGILSKVYHLIRLVRGGYAAAIFPNVSPVRAGKVYRFAMKLVQKEHVPVVVCAYRPFESLYAGMKLKCGMPEVFVIGYHLDLLTSPNERSSFIRNYKVLRGTRFFEREKGLFDLIILPKSAKVGVVASEKICYADFPLFQADSQWEDSQFRYDHECLNLSYIGTIDGENRRIDYLLTVLENVQQKLSCKVRLNIWGKIAPIVMKQIEDSEIAEYHGVIENRYTRSILENADFVVNLSNRLTPQMVPSKIFQLFSTRKPILNMVEASEDAALPYFLDNSFVCNLFRYEGDLESDIEKTTAFFQCFRGKLQSKEMIDRLYSESRPSYVLDLMEKWCSGHQPDFNTDESQQ